MEVSLPSEAGETASGTGERGRAQTVEGAGTSGGDAGLAERMMRKVKAGASLAPYR